MPHLMGHGHVGDRRRHVLAVVQEGDDAGVEAFQASAVVLKHKKENVVSNILILFWLKHWHNNLTLISNRHSIFHKNMVFKVLRSQETQTCFVAINQHL